MDDLTGMLRAAVDEPPPTRIDLDRLISGERRRRRHLTLATLGTGVAAAVATILVMPALLAAQRPTGTALPFGTPEPVHTAVPPISGVCQPLNPSFAGSQPPLQPYDTARSRPAERTEQAELRLSEALAAARRAGAGRSEETWIWIPDRFRWTSEFEGCAEPWLRWSSIYQRYTTWGLIGAGDEKWSFLIEVMPTVESDIECPWSGVSGDCERAELPDGTVATSHDVALPGGQLLRFVRLRRADSTFVHLMMSNYVYDGGEAEITAKELLLTVEEMIEIGQHPELTLYP